ncbi:hypothetical protein T484DRAFT_1902169, partial [Baffinella frigidus]
MRNLTFGDTSKALAWFSPADTLQGNRRSGAVLFPENLGVLGMQGRAESPFSPGEYSAGQQAIGGARFFPENLGVLGMQGREESPGAARGKSPVAHGLSSSPDGGWSVASTLRPMSGQRASESILEEERDAAGGHGDAHGSRGRFETFGEKEGRFEEVDALLEKLTSLGISISREELSQRYLDAEEELSQRYLDAESRIQRE